MRAAADAAQHRAVGHAGGGEHHVAPRQVLEGVFPVEVGDSHRPGAGALALVPEQQPAHHPAAYAAQRGGGEDSLRRAAGAEIDVDAGVAARSGDDPGHVAVLDQADARPRRADGGDQRFVARAVEDAGDDVADAYALGLRQRGEVRRRFAVEVDDVLRQAAADGDLVHIDVGGVEESAILGHGDDRQRVGGAGGADGGALQRVEGDVDLRAAAAHLLADIEHRRLVALALADDHRAVDGERAEGAAHGVDRRLVGGAFVAAADMARAGERRGLGDARRLERQVPVECPLPAHAAPPRPARSEPTAIRCGWSAAARPPRRGRRCRRAPRASPPRPPRAWS